MEREASEEEVGQKEADGEYFIGEENTGLTMTTATTANKKEFMEEYVQIADFIYTFVAYYII